MGLFGLFKKKDTKVETSIPAPEDVLQTFKDVAGAESVGDEEAGEEADEEAGENEEVEESQQEATFVTELNVGNNLEAEQLLFKEFEHPHSENVIILAETGTSEDAEEVRVREIEEDAESEAEIEEDVEPETEIKESIEPEAENTENEWTDSAYVETSLDFIAESPEDLEVESVQESSEDLEVESVQESSDEVEVESTEQQIQSKPKRVKKQKVPALVACFPRTHIAQVENYLLNRYVSVYECYSDVTDIINDVHSRDKDIPIKFFIFDFVNDIALYRAVIDLQEEGYVFEVQVITSKPIAASNYVQLGAQVYCVQALMDFLSLMWDSPAFDSANVLCAAQYNKKPVEYAPLAVKGLDISRLSFDMKLESVKVQSSTSSDTIYQIKINNKVTGVNIRAKSKNRVTIKDMIQQFLSTDVVRMTLKTKPGYLDNIKTALTTLDHYYTNMSTCMYDNGFISKEQSDELSALVRDSKISGICAEAEHALKLGWISEFDFLETCRQYFNVEFLDKSSVLKLDVLQRSFGLEACKHYKCFVTTGPKRDISYIVVDISNKIAIAEIGRRFDQYELVYTRTPYIEERLASVREVGVANECNG